MDLVHIYSKGLTKLQLLPIRIYVDFCCCYCSIFSSWIRILEEKLMRIRIHSPENDHGWISPVCRELRLNVSIHAGGYILKIIMALAPVSLLVWNILKFLIFSLAESLKYFKFPFFLLRKFLDVHLSVVEPFHFGPAPAPASQEGGSSSSSSSSSSPVVNNLLQKIFFIQILLINLPGLVYSKKGTSALLCSSSTEFKETD